MLREYRSCAFLPMRVQAIAQPNSRGRLALARRRRVDRGDQDQVAVLIALDGLDELCRNLCLGMTIRNEMLVR